MIGQQICGAATRFLAWRAGRQLRAIDPHALHELARDAREFARLMGRLRGRQPRVARAPTPRACSGRCGSHTDFAA